MRISVLYQALAARQTGRRFLLAVSVVVLIYPNSLALKADEDFATMARPLLQQFCLECHTGNDAEARVDLARRLGTGTLAADFKIWRKVIAVLDAQRMPPEEAQQPTAEQRRQLSSLVRDSLHREATRTSGDPGRVVIRRLTTAEYGHTIADLTSIQLDLQLDSIGDAVGGEGFTNFGGVQFVQDALLERYLAVAKQVASHCVIGTGPLGFFKDPGQTGLELSAITRIQHIYRQHGFRSASGEGGEPFGRDRYHRSFYVSWRYLHRERLGQHQASLADLAKQEGLDLRFAEHIWSVLTDTNATFPTSEIIRRWRRLPVPVAADGDVHSKVRRACQDLYAFLDDWQSRLAQTAGHEEEAAVLTESTFTAATTYAFKARIVWSEDNPTAEVRLSTTPAVADASTEASIVWRNPRLQFRRNRPEESVPLHAVLTDQERVQLAFGKSTTDNRLAAEDFQTEVPASRVFQLPATGNIRSADFLVDAQLELPPGSDCVVRAAIAWSEGPTEQKSISALLADPQGEAFRSWQQGVLDFARRLPQVSHREPAPSDRDPIPPPFDNAYNVPERDHFHYKVKYHRDDRFLVTHILDDATRRQLDQAWHDLLASFEYHDVFLKFVAKKYQFNLDGRGIAQLTSDWVDQLANEPRQHVRRLLDSYRTGKAALAAAESRHLDEMIQFAERAWRRPLEADEVRRLRSFYQELRTTFELEHTPAIRALIARILTAPSFLYRVERSLEQPGLFPLSDWELASRLSYFLWSSIPDDELRRAAAAGELRQPRQLIHQAERMLRDPKARRFATEFFGQWLGYYQFDRYRGVDPQRFPEFDDELKQAMYDEAVAFFEYIVRNDRPARDILFADYTFVNQRLARHYGIECDPSSSGEALQRVDSLESAHRGGLLGLGALLTVTSAPLRTSAVRRGDWLLRRVLGTPVPPPPADAGSIPADDVLADGQTVRERLAAHRRNPSCTNCHARIDPPGFALENYDAIGRWRDHYRDGRTIDVSAVLANGTPLHGPSGLRRYLNSQMQQFERTLCTKLLGYALGRGESLADQNLITRMMESLRSDGRFSRLVVAIVASRQFRYHRGDSQ